MKLTINGEARDIAQVGTLTELLASLGLDPRTVVVEQNRVIVRRPDLGTARLAEGDQIEIVHFVGGG